jgi:hypothetical protein
MGVSETNFRVAQGVIGTGNWKVYTIHGSRTLRYAWVPFFDDGAFVCISSTRVHLLVDSARNPFLGSDLLL